MITTSLSPPLLSLPSQRLINEAETIIYRRWRKLGLSHDAAVEQAVLFSLWFASAVAAIAERRK